MTNLRSLYMSSKVFNKQKKNRAMLAFASVGAVGAIAALSVVGASADEVAIGTNGKAMTLEPNVSAGSFDLTKQAKGELHFPVVFDRPSGVNAAALAGTVTQLGTSSTLYKSALIAVPELSDTQKMNSLLSDSLNTDSANHESAKETIVKLIKWYNSLGGQKITTQDGKDYTVDNLRDPINVIAVAFSNNNSINSDATKALEQINAAKNVDDVMKALNKYQSGVSVPYENAFDAYAKKVYAPNADINELSKYQSIKPVLDSYEKMYANGASTIRKTLINGQSSSTEAGVTFFESAVISGPTNNNGGDGSNTNEPDEDVEYTTKWVTEDGKLLVPPVTNETGYEGQKSFDDYDFVSVSTDDSTNTKTYVYKPKDAVKPEVKEDTVWVDEEGTPLKPKEPGTKPDDGSKELFPGYVVISTNTDKDANGNSHTVNVYHKIKSDTVWVDEDGKVLKEKTDGEHPDNDGKSDIDGYELVKTETVTDKNGDRHVINTYKKTDDKTPEPEPKPDVTTSWVDKDGKELKPKENGSKPDKKGDDIPGYKIVTIEEDKDGNIVNIYEKIPTADVVNTYWFDTDGNTLKENVEGTFPDTDGKSDIEGYTVQQVHLVTAKDIAEGGVFHGTTFKVGDTINIYEKVKPTDPKPEVKADTIWVDTDGKVLKPKADGAFPDNDNKSDIPGYTIDHIEDYVDEDGVRHVKNVYVKDVVKPDPIKPDPIKPTPTPTPTPTPKEEPKEVTAKSIPQTGLDGSSSLMASILGSSLMGMLGIAGFVERRRNKKNKA